MKGLTSWGSKKSRKRPIKPKIRWSLLGFTDPVVRESTSSIEDIRQQIISAAAQALSGTNPSSRARPVTTSASKRRRGTTT